MFSLYIGNEQSLLITLQNNDYPIRDKWILTLIQGTWQIDPHL